MRVKVVLLLVTLLCICLGSGCAKYYYQEGQTFNDCKKDIAACSSELSKRVTNQSTGDYEHKFMEDCMKNKGYLLVTEDKLPLGAKREDPDLSLRGFLYGQRRGIAGDLE